MLKKFIGVLILLLIPFTAAQENADESHSIRLVNLSPQFSQAEVQLNGETILENVAFETFSEWIEIPAGDHDILVNGSEENVFIGPVPFFFEGNGRSTLVLTGTIPENDLNLRVFNEPVERIPFNQVRVNFFNATDDAVFQIYAGGVFFEEITGDNPALSREFTFGIYPSVTFSTGDEVALEITLSAPHQVYTVIAAFIEGELRLFSDMVDYGTFIRVANFVPESPGIDVLLNGQPVVQSVLYELVTDAINIPYGMYELAIVPGGQGVEAALLPPQTVIFSPNEIHTFVLSGQSAEHLNLQMITSDPDDISETVMSGQNALVEVRHTVEAAPPIDILLADGTVLIEGLPYGEEVGVLDLPEGTYDFLITVSGEPENILYERSGTFLEGGKVHWMTLIGLYEDILIGRQRLSFVSFCVMPEGCE